MLDETAAANPGMKSLTVDMEDAAAIRSFAAQVAAQYPALNVLINNAGIMRAESVRRTIFPMLNPSLPRICWGRFA